MYDAETSMPKAQPRIFTIFEECHKEIEMLGSRTSFLHYSGPEKDPGNLVGGPTSNNELENRAEQLLRSIRELSKRIKV